MLNKWNTLSVRQIELSARFWNTVLFVMQAAFNSKRNASIWRPSVCLIFYSNLSVTHLGQHATRGQRTIPSEYYEDKNEIERAT